MHSSGLGESLEYWDTEKIKDKVKTSYFKGALYAPEPSQFWPAKFGYALCDLISNIVNIQTQTRVLSIIESEEGYKITTQRGLISTRIIVYATNAYTSSILPQLEGIITPVRGQVIATSPLPSLAATSIIFDEEYEYLIQRRKDGRIIFGGMRWKSKEVNIIDDTTINYDISISLREYLIEIFKLSNDSFTVDWEWTGIMGFTPDMFPLIGPLFDYKNRELTTFHNTKLKCGQYIAAGYSGHGMTLCFGVGRDIARMITGNLTPEHFIQSFNPSRFITIPQSKTLKV